MENSFGQKEKVLETVGLSKKYGDMYAVKDVNMLIEMGDIYGFVGENGAGKTTVIRLITGLAAPTEGTFYLFGEEKDKALRNRRVAGIVESVSLNKSMTALENLKYQCYICGLKKTDAELNEALGCVGLDPLAVSKRKVRNFSLGMRQRLGLASVIIRDPEFVLLDEPMNGLDPQGFIEMRETIKRLNEGGMTFLISSHILAELDRICNRIGFISGGSFVEETSVEELHRQSGKKIIMGFADAESAASAGSRLSNYPFAPSITLESDKLTIDGEQDVNQVIAAVVREEIRLTLFTEKDITLEDYYFEKVRR